MKQQSERRAENALREVVKTVETNVRDLGIILDEYEQSHTREELESSATYEALVKIYFAMKYMVIPEEEESSHESAAGEDIE